MNHDQAPVPISSAQWPEARSSIRTYEKSPEHQARFVMALLGFRQYLLEHTQGEETPKAIETVIQAFHQHYPEFTQDGFIPDSDTGTDPYRMDDRLKAYLAKLLDI